MTIGENIQTLRKSRGLSQEALAAQLRVSRQAVSKWECGESAPDAEKLSVQYLPGTIELDVQDGKITALRASVGGSVQVSIVDTQIAISASFDFRTDLTKDNWPIPAAVWEKL